MRIIHAFNSRKVWGGEDRMVETIDNILTNHGEQVYKLRERIEDLGEGFISKLQAFFKGIRSRSSFLNMIRLINEDNPEIVHVHNLYPQLTLSVLSACKSAGIPVVKHVHDYSLTCPITTHIRDRKFCHLCCDGNELWCALKDCRSNKLESFAYAIRSMIVRRFNLYTNYVSFFIVLSNFAKEHHIKHGFREDQLIVLPNPISLPDNDVDSSSGQYAAFAGRITTVKGIETLLAAAERLPHIPVRIAGDGPLMQKIALSGPNNIELLGMLNSDQLSEFYKNARFIVTPSIWFEGCPMVIIEAMGQGLPVIASKIGGLPEIVDDSETGLLFEPGNPEDLVSKMKLLWENPDLCRKMGQAGWEKAIREYSEDVYYQRLMAVYQKAIEISKQE